MSNIHEQLERLICRSLDGDLSDDEQLVLNRELIRNPEARQLLADYQAVDRDATAALLAAFGRESEIPEVQPAKVVSISQARRRHTVRWLIPGAIAAALLATVIPNPWRESQTPLKDRFVAAPTTPSTMPSVSRPSVPTRTVSTGTGAPAVHRDTGREIIGVLGDDGNLYWIEVERTRTVKLPHGPAATSRSMNEF